MAELYIPKKTKKFLLKSDKSLSSTQTFTKTIDRLKKDNSLLDVSSRLATMDTIKENSLFSTNLKQLYYDSIGKYLNKPSPRSQTPDIIISFNTTERSRSPILGSSMKTLNSQFNFKPMLNKNSLKIASKLKSSNKKLVTTTPTKLLSQKLFTHKPSINRNSNNF